jgi:DNA-binding transcriptional LysR family regulator
VARLPSKRYFKELRFQQLLSFAEAARVGSFAGAAQVLGVSRPAVWQQIRSLERELGAICLLRRGNRLDLTREGRLLSELVAPLVAGFQSLRSTFEERRASGPPRLVVATTSGLLLDLLQRPIGEFRRRFPEVQLGFLDRVSSEALDLVLKERARIGIVGHLEEEPKHPELVYERLSDFPFSVVCPKGHELLAIAAPRLPELLRFPLILMARGSRARARVDQVLRSRSLEDRARIAMDTTNAAMILEYVKSGLGIGIASFVTAAAPRWNLVARSVARLFGHERIMFVQRKDATPEPHASTFRSILKKSLEVP